MSTNGRNGSRQRGTPREPLRQRLGLEAGVHFYSLKCLLRGSRWLAAVPLLVTLAVTLCEVLWRSPVSPLLQVTTGEIMGSLLAGFFGANLLDAEVRLEAGEPILTKPYPVGRLLCGRVLTALTVTLLLVGANSAALHEFRHLHHAGLAIASAVAPGLFLCALGCLLFTATGSVIFGYSGPILFWIWSTIGAPVGVRFDRLYNPLFQISAMSDYLENPTRAGLETLIGDQAALLVAALLLFWWSTVQVRKAVLR